ncbi:hypothetical protein ACSDQ9_01330 [Aestuariimicrobium soli]|uniref:hypothetical protein n=1 Tax=Aestuariimicrobium soli TaxID=2035834 RepID=UPI003EB8229D
MQGACGTIEHARAMARQGIEPQRTLVELGTMDAEAAEIRWLQAHRTLLDDPPG